MSKIPSAGQRVANRPAHRVAGLVLAGASLAMIASADTARTHTHANKDGTTISWYPVECCHDGDCRPVASINRTRQGLWMTTVDGYKILADPREQRRPSRDLHWHICVGTDDTETPIVRCIFEPSNS